MTATKPSSNTSASTSRTTQTKPSIPTWLGICMTVAMVVVVRESSVWVCQQFGIATAGNIVGLVVMFLLLMGWRLLRQSLANTSKNASANATANTTESKTKQMAVPHLPTWLTNASNKLLIDSGFAFLPVSAGAGLLIMALGDEMWGIIITLVVSTLVPMWALAKLADVWLKESE